MGPRTALAKLLERRLFDRGYSAAIAGSEGVAQALQSAGLIAILNTGPEVSLPSNDQGAVTHLIGLLKRGGVLISEDTPERNDY